MLNLRLFVDEHGGERARKDRNLPGGMLGGHCAR